jgi:hypothetical protein
VHLAIRHQISVRTLLGEMIKDDDLSVTNTAGYLHFQLTDCRVYVGEDPQHI